MSDNSTKQTFSLTLTTAPLEARKPRPRCYLLCVDGDSSSTFHLPEDGEITVGRAPEAQLRAQDSLVSRRHAKLLVSGNEVRVSDLKSRHGTRVNGQPLTSSRVLISGDVITMGGLSLVLHRDVRPNENRPLFNAAEMRRRLEDEIERALHYQRQAALIVIDFAQSGDRPLDRALIAAHMAGCVRLIDAVGFIGSRQLAVIAPELSAESAATMAPRLLESLGRVAPGLRIGVAACPNDGCDTDVLMSSAQAAIEDCGPGSWSTAAHASTVLDIRGHGVVVADPAMRRIYKLIVKLAKSHLPILVNGETGSGKELAAQAIHEYSPRREGPFVAINCAALPESLVESELFGHEKGAFTGAQAARKGIFERASGGTVFLDELGELSLGVQAKLLRALETQRITRLGDTREREIDIRLVAATNRDLKQEIAAGRFREDLFFRLSAACVVLPPLRDRPRELPVLARSLLARSCKKLGRETPDIAPAAMRRLFAHTWPGNVRELKNTMDYAAATALGDGPGAVEIDVWHLPDEFTRDDEAAADSDAESPAPAAESDGATETPVAKPAFRPIAEEVRDLERMRMIQALEATDWVQNKAAALISMPLRTFVTKLKRYEIPASRKRRS